MDLEVEISRLEKVVKTIKVKSPSAEEVFTLAKAYLSDARYFLSKGERDNALEAYAIAWAYLDALLHLGLIEVEDTSLFTVDPK